MLMNLARESIEVAIISPNSLIGSLEGEEGGPRGEVAVEEEEDEGIGVPPMVYIILLDLPANPVSSSSSFDVVVVVMPFV